MTSMEASRGTQNTNVEAEFDREDVREWGTMNSIFTGRDVQLLSTPELNMVLGAATRHREISNESVYCFMRLCIVKSDLFCFACALCNNRLCDCVFCCY